MANISSINGNPILALALADSPTATITASAKIRGINNYEVVYGKYAAYNASGLVIGNKSDMGYVRIDGSEVMGELLEISGSYPDTTYNIVLIQVLDNDTVIATKPSGQTKFKRFIIPIRSEDVADVYINFLNNNGSIDLDVSISHSLAVKHGYVATVFQPFEYDPIAHTITVQNYRNSEWTGAEQTVFPVTIQYDNTSVTPFTASTSAFKHTIENVTSGFFYFDINDGDFKFSSTFVLSNPLSTKVIIAEFFNGVMDPPNAMRTIDNVEKHNGKHIFCYGDSLTWYDGQNATWGPYVGEPIVGYESYLRAYCHAAVYNFGTSGYTIPETCSRMVNESASGNFDILLLMGGDNDDRRGVSVGTILPHGSAFDTNTTIGAMQNAIETILGNNPKAVIALMTEPMGWKWDSDENSLVRVDEAYPNAIRSVAEYYGLPLLDLWKVSGVNEMTRNQMYLDPPDTTNQLYMYHPSNYGWKVISERIVKFVQSL